MARSRSATRRGRRAPATIIRPEKLHEAQKRLEEIGSPAFTISDVRSHGLQTGIRGTWRGEPYVLQVVHKIKVEVLCDHGQVDQVAKTLAEASRTGQLEMESSSSPRWT
jgi:nitrogen regulatory protein P-II 1